MKWEVQALEKPHFHTTLSSAYAGGDGHNKEKYPSRNMDGLTDIFTNYDIGDLTIIGWEGESAGKVRYTGFVSRQAMYNEMSKHSIGLIPWKKHWSHVFTSPNKPYEYAHAGLFVMCTSCLKPVSETLKENCITFENYNDLVSQLEYFKENLDELYNKRLKIFEFARNNLIWENYEKNIFRAYQLC
jgi:glycosyltransferase involved in cell wall biosynthesis